MTAATGAARRTDHGDIDLLRAMRESIRAATLRPEAELIAQITTELRPMRARLAVARLRATRWVVVARADRRARPFAESLMEQFPLDSAQGRALMSLAEALLRTPDRVRADQLISERLAAVRRTGVSGSDTWFLRTGFALLGLASRLLPDVDSELSGRLSAAALAKPIVAPVVRSALRGAMRMLGEAFIVG